ncbi:myeloid leukemia factor 2 isoform X1 [Erpetoichthys calabaricus]|uniref:Myeloid leukemia factor 2 n=2 Tax=Erpetoichthys calabaricus TaxID=27687 RepID=A0A8C4SAE6_ERPCA|nr:myeloid leukemia factor 2 isoform X1 [Erpetoichthys calabaricus]XP_028665869.1 myeloid leukemia factor 2 isoform X1 [Erpetoichthys calabaricus]
MFRYLSDMDDNPFMMDPFTAHQQQMRSMFSSFGLDPFLGITDGRAVSSPLQPARRPQVQHGALSPYGMMGMGGGFMDMFGMMGSMMDNMERMASSANCQTFSSTIFAYSNTGSGAPKVYQQTSEMRTAPGGIRETLQTVRDSESGLERMSIGHHIGERGHVMERSRNRRTGDREERQDYINLEEGEAAAFDEEWFRETSRYGPSSSRSLDYRRDRNAAAGGGSRLAIAAPHSHEDDDGIRHQHSSRRYDW